MLKDIRNVMSLKRANSTSDCLRAKLLNLTSGKKYAVPEKEDEEVSPREFKWYVQMFMIIIFIYSQFVFGRSLSSSIVIEHPCVSRRHCVIRFENNQYTIFDNVSSFNWCFFLLSEEMKDFYLTVSINMIISDSTCPQLCITINVKWISLINMLVILKLFILDISIHYYKIFIWPRILELLEW